MSASAQPTQPTPPAANGTPALEVRGVTKSFGVLNVLRGIDLTLRQGEVLGLVGDNGAGKSTLVKILSGFHQPDGGEVLIGGSRRELQLGPGCAIQGNRDRLPGPRADSAAARVTRTCSWDTRSRGSGRCASSTSARCASSRASTSTRSTCTCRAWTPMPSCSPAASVRRSRSPGSVRAASKILLLDEPLAAMGARESRLIINLVKELAASGRVSIIVIDHNYAHLFELCDRINVMQGGRITIRPGRARDVDRGAHRADGLELSPPDRGGPERRRVNPPAHMRSGSTSERSPAAPRWST